jgi:hypothetical protein
LTQVPPTFGVLATTSPEGRLSTKPTLLTAGAGGVRHGERASSFRGPDDPGEGLGEGRTEKAPPRAAPASSAKATAGAIQRPPTQL